MEKQYCVYLLASKEDGVLYVGVTGDLKKRMHEHKNGVFEGFTKKYFVKNLVWYECGTSAEGAIIREKQIKKWNRDWKIRLITERNPVWKDLSGGL